MLPVWLAGEYGLRVSSCLSHDHAKVEACAVDMKCIHNTRLYAELQNIPWEQGTLSLEHLVSRRHCQVQLFTLLRCES